MTARSRCLQMAPIRRHQEEIKLHKGQALVTLADPYEPERCWGDQKYSLCNMLLRQVNFPLVTNAGDILASVYSDHVYDAFGAACKSAFSKMTDPYPGPFDDGRPLYRLTEKQFLSFVRVASGLPKKRRVTGARVVRYTNVATGYPVYRLDTYAPAGANAPAGAKLVNCGYSNSYDAPNIARPEPRLLFNSEYDMGLDEDGRRILY